MASKNELTHCDHCGRNNWHENTRCSWCARKLPTITTRFMNHLMMIISVVSLLAIAIGLAVNV